MKGEDTKKSEFEGEKNATDTPQILNLNSEILIKRRTIIFKIPAKELFKLDAIVFECKRCGYTWLPQKKNGKRGFGKVPRTCPNCFDNYWFISKEDLKNVRSSYSIGKAKSKKNQEPQKAPIKILRANPKPIEDSNRDERRSKKEFKKAKW